MSATTTALTTEPKRAPNGALGGSHSTASSGPWLRHCGHGSCEPPPRWVVGGGSAPSRRSTLGCSFACAPRAPRTLCAIPPEDFFLERPRHDMSWCCTVLSAPPWRFEITGDICPHFSSLSSSRQRADRSTPFSGVSVEAPKPLRSLTTLTCPWPFWLKAQGSSVVGIPYRVSFVSCRLKAPTCRAIRVDNSRPVNFQYKEAHTRPESTPNSLPHE